MTVIFALWRVKDLFNITLTTGQNITQDTCISLLATRLKIQLILFNYCGKDKAHYISPKAKYSGLHFYFEFKSLCLLQFRWLFMFLVKFRDTVQYLNGTFYHKRLLPDHLSSASTSKILVTVGAISFIVAPKNSLLAVIFLPCIIIGIVLSSDISVP